MDLVKASQGHTFNLSKYRFSQYPSHQSLRIFIIIIIIFFYKTISLNFCIRSTSVLFCPLQSSSFHFGPIWPTLVLIGLIWSILFTSVYLVHFGLIRSVRSTSVLLCSIRSFRFYSVHFSLFCSLCSYSVQFGPPWSTLVLFG